MIEHQPWRGEDLSRLAPPSCAAYEMTADPADVALHPEEEMFIAEAPAARRAEFATVRICARQALVELGFPPGPLLPGHRGAPNWPAGSVGSMTHCAGYRAAMVATSLDVLAIGIDAEPHEPLPEEVLELVSTSAERRHLVELAQDDPATHWDRVLFCAKEAIYKAWSPMSGTWLGFHDVDVRLIGSRTDGCGEFSLRPLVSASQLTYESLRAMQGRWSSAAGRVHTAAWIPVHVT